VSVSEGCLVMASSSLLLSAISAANLAAPLNSNFEN
jgi:hypothetical protein